MRVTEGSLADRYLASIGNTKERMTVLQTQLATGKRVTKVSDDPQGTNSILRLKTLIADNEQFSANTTEAQTMMESTESSLDGFADVLQKIKEMLVRANNGALTDELPAFGQSIDQLLDDAVDAANTKFNGKYIFGGTNTLQAPFTLAADRSAVTVNPGGITGDIQFQLGEGMMQKVNIDGQQAFQGTAMFDLIIRLRDTLLAKTPPAAADAQALDDAYQHVISMTSTAGMITEQLNSNVDHLESQHTQLLNLLSVQQDTDVASAITHLTQEETNLNAALQTTARIIPKSLLDFLT